VYCTLDKDGVFRLNVSVNGWVNPLIIPMVKQEDLEK
jgi:hypothetical protein